LIDFTTRRIRSSALSVALLACLLAAGVPAGAQTISGASGSTSGSTGNSGDSDGSIRSSVATQINNGTTFKTRFAWNLSSDVGAASTRDSNGTAKHNLSFNVTAPGGYRLDITQERTGIVQRNSDISGCDGAADISGVTGTQSGGSIVAGDLNLSDPGGIGNGGGDANTPFDQTNSSAAIAANSNGSAVGHTLAFTWNGSTRSNSCEAAVRLGEGSSVSGCDACTYPGTPSRTQSSDGHFVTVTLVNLCGNGTVDSVGPVAEQCDPPNGVCCDSTCHFASNATVCRAASGVCDVAENCTGSGSNCPANGFASGTTCRGAAGVCDNAELCDGSGPNCPANAFKPSSTVCRPNAGVCDVAENCTGSSAACPGDGFASTSVGCRPSAGVCDLADNCPGSGPNCSADAKSTAVCRPSTTTCDATEVCNGVGNSCPADGVASTSVVCRSAAGVCDVVEHCNGVTSVCPADAKSTAVCRAAAGVCDVAESCDGVNDFCPPNAVAPATQECRPNVGNCDVPESCDGASVACPADVVAPSTQECRAGADVCDVAENCDGASGVCPTDGFAPSTQECRPTNGVCDVAENCSGSDAACPADGFAPATQECRAAADVCDAAESCSGSDVDCPADGFAPSTQECRASAGVCDVAESCTGSGTACPTDAFELASTTCRAVAGDCDVAESCTGSAADCPADAVQPSSFECRGDSGDCDVAESCDGSTVDCPVDASEPDGTSCSDTNSCTIDDICVAGVCTGDSMLCGDGTVQGGCGEQCDDGGTDADDGCSPTCQVEPGLGCAAAPLPGCRQSVTAGKSSVQLADKIPDSKDQLKWKWVTGAATTTADFGNPATITDYQLCVYDSSGLRLSARAPHAGVCAAKACWRASGTSGFKYKDKDLTPDGISQIQLKAGVAGKAKIQVQGKGTFLDMPSLTSLTQPVTVQIQNTTGTCWESVFSAPPTVQSATQFKDRAD
jgi:cysteine-rich repeat protein